MLSNKIDIRGLNTSPILKPFDPLLDSLPVEMTSQLMTARYITVATLALFIWEILINIFNDYKLLFEHRIRLPTIVYFISRLSCLVFIVCATVLRVSSIVSTRSCRMLERTVDIVYSSTVALTTLLFFFRTRAVFDQNRWIIAFFAGLWLTVSVGCLAFIIYALVSSHPECIDKRANPFIALTTITPLINDTLVFLAITWRLFRNSYARPTLKSGFRFLVFGDYLPAFSRALLRDGQAYYLTIITVNIITVIMLFNHSLPSILQSIFGVPNLALANIMACRVFRNTKLPDSEEIPSEFTLSLT